MNDITCIYCKENILITFQYAYSEGTLSFSIEDLNCLFKTNICHWKELCNSDPAHHCCTTLQIFPSPSAGLAKADLGANSIICQRLLCFVVSGNYNIANTTD